MDAELLHVNQSCSSQGLAQTAGLSEGWANHYDCHQREERAYRTPASSMSFAIVFMFRAVPFRAAGILSLETPIPAP